MFITITFTKDNLEARILHNLPHVHKTFPVLKHCIRQIDENSQMYYLRNDAGEIVAECHYQIDENQLSFTLFNGKWKKDLQKMFTFLLVEEIGEKAYIATEKMNLFYDFDNFFLMEKDKSFKIGTDYESIITVDSYHIPLEIRHL
jgi:hypothetical protein